MYTEAVEENEWDKYSEKFVYSPTEKTEAKIKANEKPELPPIKFSNGPEFQKKLNIIKAIQRRAIQIREAVEEGQMITLPSITLNYNGEIWFLVAISEDGFKVRDNDNLLEYIWLERIQLNHILQTILKLKLETKVK